MIYDVGFCLLLASVSLAINLGLTTYAFSRNYLDKQPHFRHATGVGSPETGERQDASVRRLNLTHDAETTLQDHVLRIRRPQHRITVVPILSSALTKGGMMNYEEARRIVADIIELGGRAWVHLSEDNQFEKVYRYFT